MELSITSPIASFIIHTFQALLSCIGKRWALKVHEVEQGKKNSNASTLEGLGRKFCITVDDKDEEESNKPTRRNK